MSKYDLYRNTICKDNDNDYIILFKDEESAKIVFDEFNQKDQRIAELEKQLKQQDTETLLLKKALMIATKRANRLNKHCDELKGIYNAKFPYSDEVEYERAIKIAKKELNILEDLTNEII